MISEKKCINLIDLTITLNKKLLAQIYKKYKIGLASSNIIQMYVPDGGFFIRSDESLRSNLFKNFLA